MGIKPLLQGNIYFNWDIRRGAFEMKINQDNGSTAAGTDTKRRTPISMVMLIPLIVMGSLF